MHPAPSCLEALEPRLAPAGIVTVSVDSHGVVTLRGDAADNLLMITQDPATGSLVLTGSYDTLFEMHGQPDQGQVQELTLAVGTSNGLLPLAMLDLNLGGGNDSIYIFQLDTDASVSITDTLATGKEGVTIQESRIGGPLKVSLGGGDDFLNVQDSFLESQLVFSGGTGIDGVYLNRGGYAGLSLNFGPANREDNDRFQLYAGNDLVLVKGNVEISGGGALEKFEANTFDFIGGNIVIEGNLTVKNGTGHTSVSLGRDNGDSVTIHGNLLGLTAGGSLGFSSASWGRSTSLDIEGNVKLHAGAGGSLWIAFGQKTQGEILGSEVSIGGSLMVSAGRDRAVHLAGESVQIGGDIRVVGGGVGGSLLLEGHVQVGGDLYFNTRGTGERVLRASTETLQVGGDVFFRASGSKVESALVLAATEGGSVGHVTFTGGQYINSLALSGSEAGMVVRGDITANLSRGRVSFLLLQDLQVLGDVQAKMHSMPVRQLPYYQTFTNVVGSEFQGEFSLRHTGALAGQYRITSNVFQGPVHLQTGSGADELYLGAYTTNFHTAPSAEEGYRNTFHDEVRIHLGRGDDSLKTQTGMPQVPTGNLFLGPALIDGSSGNDYQDYLLGSNQAPTLPLIRFELQPAP